MPGFMHGRPPMTIAEATEAAEEHVSRHLEQHPVGPVTSVAERLAAKRTAEETAAAPEESQGDLDEVSTKRVEHQLVEMGDRFAEARAALGSLRGQFNGRPCAELIERIDDLAEEIDQHSTRLMCEARKALRGDS